MLYFGGLSFGIYNRTTNKEGDEQKLDLSKADNAFMEGVDRLLGLFAPSLNLDGVKCNEQLVNSDFLLTEPQPHCTLMLKNTDEKGEQAKNNRRGQLQFGTTASHVYVCFNEKDKKSGQIIAFRVRQVEIKPDYN